MVEAGSGAGAARRHRGSPSSLRSLAYIERVLQRMRNSRGRPQNPRHPLCLPCFVFDNLSHFVLATLICKGI